MNTVIDPSTEKFIRRKNANRSIFDQKNRLYIYVEGITDSIFWRKLLHDQPKAKDKLKILTPTQGSTKVLKDGKKSLKKILKQAHRHYENRNSIYPALGFADRDLDPVSISYPNLIHYDGWDRECMLASLGLLEKVLIQLIDHSKYDQLEELSQRIRSSSEIIAKVRKKLPTFHNWKSRPSLRTIIQKDIFLCHRNLRIAWSYLRTLKVCSNHKDNSNWIKLIDDISEEGQLIDQFGSIIWDCRGHDLCQVTAIALSHGEWTYKQENYEGSDIEEKLSLVATIKDLRKTEFWQRIIIRTEEYGINWEELFE